MVEDRAFLKIVCLSDRLAGASMISSTGTGSALVHDDIIDNSPLRRGAKTLNFQWGNEVTVLMGDFIFARVFGLLARSVEAPVIQAISVATDRLCEGEIQEVHSRFLVTLSEKE